jgi:hypothetical protein
MTRSASIPCSRGNKQQCDVYVPSPRRAQEWRVPRTVCMVDLQNATACKGATQLLS